MEKRFVAVVIIIFVLITSVSFPSWAQDMPVRDLTQIMDSGKVIVAMVDGEYPPFITHGEDGQLAGTEVDLARAATLIGKRLTPAV
jgi:ABC-type amino acid transport substrate-binding protein